MVEINSTALIILSTLTIVAPFTLLVYFLASRNKDASHIHLSNPGIIREHEHRFPLHDIHYVIETLTQFELRSPDVDNIIQRRLTSLQPSRPSRSQDSVYENLAKRIEIYEAHIRILESQLQVISKEKIGFADLVVYSASAIAFLVGVSSGVITLLGLGAK